ncbi:MULTISPECIES: ABC transporter substrate-binding protein [Streptomyces]|uniref:Thiamine pyrimidine synthase n=1 Tax=Streptomyces griseoaurantiacus TaxID=68213 RepID=A0ABZ1UXE5_9ACTN|nr:MULTISPECIES: ABC transporter substrate-binding protein [Streptomyces]MCF0087604.1 putative aliphatic sulfonates-binding protein [Streptomyces sp. MH192]MCF0099655.1 putative aliphatic sulfonates-binding protein [Streptomyces sp. MH191]MDX3090230.1 ABC transporter substrate-binding protein [Streptomyces sp. ME12-02E]MDX3332388.1 ABC transporter substrate-binding protein [Streptomyces sp. ME02-6978a]MDX3358908.1 ABC transporter substrate-binding protein [Streptomyces sp. ME02-6978.2a]
MTRRLKSLTGLFAGILVVATLSACGSEGGGSAGGDDLDTVTFALSAPSWNAGYTTLVVPEAEGYFKDEGLDVKVELFPSGTQTAQQLAAGGADVGLMTGEPVAIGHAKNLGLAYFASYYPHWIYSLQLPKGSDVRNVADLKGKKIGVTAVASSGGTFARTALELNGMSENAAALVPIGAGAQQINAIKSGQVDALALWDTQYAIVEDSGIELTPLPVPQTAGIWGGGFAATRKTIDKRKDVLERFGRAIAKGFAFAQANPEAAIRDLWKLHPETRGTGPEKDAMASQAKILQVRLADQGVEDDDWGRIDPKAATGMVEFMASAGLVGKAFPATEIYTTDLLDAINDFSYDDIRKQAKDAS